MSGLMSITGDKEPFKVGYAVTDVITGQMLHSSILAGLFARERDPESRGMRVDANLLASNLYVMS